MQMEKNHLLDPMNQQQALQAMRAIISNQQPISTIYQGSYSLVAGAPHQDTAVNNQNGVFATLSISEVEKWVHDIVVKCTKFRDLKNDEYLLERGVDSIIAINIAANINQLLSKVSRENSVAKTLLFQHGTVSAISKHLIDNHYTALSASLGTALPQTKIDPVTETETYRDDDIAVIGMAGEFPGADDIHELWQLLKDGKSAISEVPATRWNWRDHFSVDTTKTGHSYSRHGGFIQNAQSFDAPFFKIAPVQAEKMDPQARRLLHQSYLALDDCDFFSQSTDEIGVFTAAMYGHYQNLNCEEKLVDSSLSALANHVSYFFNFKGPSLSVDTMCSGSLTALHLAMNSLRLKECQLALVGGVNIMSHPGKYRFLSEEKFLSPTGHCYSFGIGADGYVPGEGAVVLVLKPLKQAMLNQNKIYGVIRGSSLNSVGHGSAFTVPSAAAQADVIRKALAQAKVSPDKISYIEAHGTGTSLGDPIEIEGLNMAYGAQNNTPCKVGAIKSNIGHLESAAGLASIVKVLLQMHYRSLVPSLFCNIENPNLPLNNSRLQLQKKFEKWGSENDSLYAGVSAFGAGGSNAHLIMQNAPLSHQRQNITKPNHHFKQERYWADLHSVKSDVKSTPKTSVEALILKPEKTECASPLENHHAQRKIYLCNESQAESVAIMLTNTSSRHIVINDHNNWQHALRNTINDTFDENTVYLVNLCALDANQTIREFTKNQFELAKLLASLNKSIFYQHHTHHKAIDNQHLHLKSFSALFRTLTLEKSNFTMRLVESDHSTREIINITSGKFNEVESTYQHYLFDNKRWYQQQYTEDRAITQVKSAPLLKQSGIYLLAGGLGSVGIIIADMLMKRYHATVILLGRSALSGNKQRSLEMLKSNTGKIEYQIVNINEISQVEQCVENIINKYGRLDGVIQTTSVLHDGLLRDKDFSDFSDVISSKMNGTFNLDEATKNLTLDFFVLFSSISSVFGNAGQSDYCVANTYLDLFSGYRDHLVSMRNRSGYSLSINWPLWQVEGLTLDQATIDFICEETGLRPLNAQQGADIFEQLVNKNIDKQMIPLVGNIQKLKNRFIHTASVPAATKHLSQQADILASVKHIVEEVTKTPAASLTPETEISELGFNSVLLAEMATKIEKHFAITIAPSAFFTYNNLTKIAAYVLSKLSLNKESVVVPTTVSSSDNITQDSPEHDDDFAIIGLDGLLPGGPDIPSFWESLIHHKSAVSRVERWKDGEYYAATIPDIECFDSKFFGISNREAMLMDPQHRLFLQTAYNAILNAGYTPPQLSHVGVFVGVQFSDYHSILQAKNQTKHPYAATGNAHAMLANRVSYLFNFHGPSQTIDTACSSALVAINRGLLALKHGECDTILTGAVSLLIDPVVTDAATTMGILSPQYRCATFDGQADGYVRGEGVGCFVIKRYKDAISAGDSIHAVIKSFSENHGGKANSLTAPNPMAQKELLIKAYHSSLAKRVSYIETHGTGTNLGDPVEIDALTQAFAVLHPEADKESIYLGAVKTNVGHLEPAAAIPSLMKVIFALKHKVLPANINFKKQNPFIQLEGTPFKLLTNNTPWTSKNNLVAGVSSFGFGGSNAHMVLTNCDDQPVIPQLSSNAESYLFTLSARSTHSLLMMRLALIDFLKNEGKEHSLQSISYTLNIGREHFEYRLAVISENLTDLISALSDDNVCTITRVTVDRDQVQHSNTTDTMREYLNGKNIKSVSLYGNSKIKKAHLPGYCFDKKHLWCCDSDTTTLQEAL